MNKQTLMVAPINSDKKVDNQNEESQKSGFEEFNDFFTEQQLSAQKELNKIIKTDKKRERKEFSYGK